MSLNIPTKQAGDKITSAEYNEIVSAVNANEAAIANKVDKDGDKVLSSNDFTDAEKTKLAGIEQGAEVNLVTSVADRTGDITLTKGDVGLGNVDNTSDEDKPISTAAQMAFDAKQDLPDIVTQSSPSAITLADNTEYFLTGVSDLTFTYPNSEHWDCVIVLTTASSGTVSISFPQGTAYIGDVPNFSNSETWEISIRDGIVVTGKAVSV